MLCRSFVMDKSTKSVILQIPTEFDERFSHQPTSYLAQAILSNSFHAADLILRKYPEILDKQIVCIVAPHLRKYFAGSYSSSANSFLLGSDIEPIPEYLPLIQYVLLAGSYKSCAYLLQNLVDSRQVRQSPRRTSRFQLRRRSTPSEERAWTRWSTLILSTREYHFMLVGLVKDDRKDRYSLWDVVGSQVEKGHSTHWYYLRLALFYANSMALRKLLQLGWNVNGPPWAVLITPLMLAKRLESSRDDVLPSLEIAYKKLQGPRSKAGALEYINFSNSFNARYSTRSSKLTENVKILQENGAYSPPLLESRVFRFWIWVSYSAFYLLFFPLTLGFKLDCKHVSRRSTIGWMYLGSIIAALMVPCVLHSTTLLWNRPRSRKYYQIVDYYFLPILWLGNHVSPPLILYFGPPNSAIFIILLLLGASIILDVNHRFRDSS